MGMEFYIICNKYFYCMIGLSLCGLLVLLDKLEIVVVLLKDFVNKYICIS